MLLQALCIISWPSVNLNWSYSPETPNLGQNRRSFVPCDLEIWRMTLKNNRALLLCYFKLCCFILQPYVNSNWSYSPETAILGFDLCDRDLWPWPLAWTSLVSMVITPENFMMIRWEEHSVKGVTDRRTDRQTDGQTERGVLRAAWSQLKMKRYFWSRGLTYDVEEVFPWKICTELVISFELDITKIRNSIQIILSSASNFGNTICFYATTPSEKSTIAISTDVATKWIPWRQ